MMNIHPSICPSINDCWSSSTLDKALVYHSVHTHSLEYPLNIMLCLWTVGGNQSTQRIQTPHPRSSSSEATVQHQHAACRQTYHFKIHSLYFCICIVYFFYIGLPWHHGCRDMTKQQYRYLSKSVNMLDPLSFFGCLMSLFVQQISSDGQTFTTCWK